MTGRCVKTDIRLSRLSGGTHLSWMVDELDLPWLLHVIGELDVEEDATVSLHDPEGDGRLVVRIGENGFAVECSSAGVHARLTRLPAGDGVPAKADTSIDFDAVREAVAAFLQDRQPGGDLRWIGQASNAERPDGGTADVR